MTKNNNINFVKRLLKKGKKIIIEANIIRKRASSPSNLVCNKLKIKFLI